MKGAFALGLATVATAAFNDQKSAKLQVYSKVKSQNFLSGRLVVGEVFDTEWWWGIRSPVDWAEFMKYHEAVYWAEELYTKMVLNSSVTATLSESNGKIIIGATVNPYLTVMDIAFWENLFMWWPKKEEDRTCWYNGWWFEIMYLYVDLSLVLRECKVGTHDYLFNSGKFACSATGGGYIWEAYYKPLTKLARYNEGRYDASWDSCHEFEDFKMHEKEVRSIKEAFEGVKDDSEDLELDDFHPDNN